ncbi:MAG: hypothetical protein QXO58_00795 [Thermoplasmata archaeon]
MIQLYFSPNITECPVCVSKLKAYKTVRKIVRSVNLGTFIAVEKIKQCKNNHERMIFRSETLRYIIASYCKYANDVMVKSAKMRFIEGKICSEIAIGLGLGFVKGK